jgi:hypothetical protein
VLALAWGTWSTLHGNAEARQVSRERGVPSSATITTFSIMLNERLAQDEPVMSNLGPSLAWGSLHPVLHLSHTPGDVPACRRRLEFRHILLVFREGPRAWAGWNEIVEQEGYAATIPGLNVVREDRYRTRDGFIVVWLELGPQGPALAASAGR